MRAAARHDACHLPVRFIIVQKELDTMDENLRKLVHMCFGLAISAAVIFIERDCLLAFLAASLLAGFALSDALRRGYRIPPVNHLIDRLERKGEIPGKGALFFVLSAFVSLVLFESYHVFLALIVLSTLDGIATIAGKNFGRRMIINGKTLEGSIAGTMAAFLLLLPFASPMIAAIVTIVGAAIELVSPIDDNLTIPPLLCVLLHLIH